MSPKLHPLGVFALALLSLATGAGCSGSSGGGSGASGDGLMLVAAYFGRGLETADGFRVLSPLTTVKTDPVTGRAVDSTLTPLGPGVDLEELVTLGLGPQFVPVVVPRNAVIVLRFSRRLDPASVRADELDAGGNLVTAGSVRVRDQEGNVVAVELRTGGTDIIIDPTTPDEPGFPASPLVFDSMGNGVADPTGFLRIILPRQGGHVLRGEGGESLRPRPDNLGDTQVPIGFNPGNTALDFIARNNLFPWGRGFNGFLPDLHAPRVVREHTRSGTLSLDAGDEVGPTSIFLHDVEFNTTANGGNGEWAGRLLTVRPGSHDEERHFIQSNDSQRVTITDSFRIPPVSGDLWQLSRTEYYEPDPSNPIDSELFDRENPENANNMFFRNFVTFEEITAAGDYADANGDGKLVYTANELVPSRSVLKVRFSEPMDVASFLPYESFRVTAVPEPDVSGFEYVGWVQAEEGGLVIGYWPMREDQSGAGLHEYMGFGPETEGNRLIILRTVPEISYLQERLDPEDLAAFIAKGYRGVTDLGGLPLAFASTEFSKSRVYIESAASFSFATTPDELYSRVGAVVHRFQGAPRSGLDPETGEPGLRYVDQEGFYGPVLADMNLLVNGVLAPAPVGFYRRTVDDYPGNAPPGNRYDAWPLGAGAPISGSFQGGVTYASIYGVRFQHVYAVAECSVSPTGDLRGSLFDLYRIAFAPIGGNVTHDVYEDISVHAGHSVVVPTSNQYSGLGAAFDTATFLDPNKPCGSSVQYSPNYIDPLRLLVKPRTTWVLDQSNLFTPSNTVYAYHPWPAFEKPFRYNNNDSLTLEYRIRPQETAISYQNGFTFSAAALNSPFPRHRVYSFGSSNNILIPDPEAGDLRAKCAVGPQAKPQKFGDNSRYFYTFDYVKTTSSIRSPFVAVTETADPRFLGPVLTPPPEQLPPGTRVLLELRAAEDPVMFEGKPDDGWTTDVEALAGLDWIQFRIQVEGNPETLLMPTFDTIVLPYYR
ncbi:MAG: hypothetical protein AB1486_07775 [Planctomycetota bacterium]